MCASSLGPNADAVRSSGSATGRVDEFVEHVPVQCGCGYRFDGSEERLGDPVRRQKWELPLVVPLVFEHRLHRVVCPGCGKAAVAGCPPRCLRNDSFARRRASSRRCWRVIGGSFDGANELSRESWLSSRSCSSTRSRSAVISANKPSTSSTAGPPPARAIRSASATRTNARFRAPQRNPSDHPDPT